MKRNSQRLILFDVDQTLVSLSGGSGKALNSAFEEVHGIPDAFLGMTSAGGLDLPLMKEMYRKWHLMPHVQKPFLIPPTSKQPTLST